MVTVGRMAQGEAEGTDEGHTSRPKGQGTVKNLYQVQSTEGFDLRVTSQRLLRLPPERGDPSKGGVQRSKREMRLVPT